MLLTANVFNNLSLFLSLIVMNESKKPKGINSPIFILLKWVLYIEYIKTETRIPQSKKENTFTKGRLIDSFKILKAIPPRI